MATLVLADIVAAFNLLYMDELADAIRRDSVLLSLLSVQQDRNSTCTWSVKTSARNTAKVSTGADVSGSDFSNHERSQASLAWARYEGFAAVDGLAQALSAANAPGRIGVTIDPDVLREEVMDAIDEVAMLLSTHAYTGNPASNQISGADTMAAGNTYAGIDKTALTTPAEWAAAVNTEAASALDFDVLRTKLIRPFKDATGRLPEFITCDGATFDRVGALFGSDRRYIDTVTTASAGTVDLKLAGGFNALEFDGVPIIEDRHATADTLYAWDSRSSSFRQVPTMQSAMVPGDRMQGAVKALTGSGFPADAADRIVAQRVASATGRLQPSIHPLAKLGDSERMMVKVYVQLRHKSRKAHAQLSLT